MCHPCLCLLSFPVFFSPTCPPPPPPPPPPLRPPPTPLPPTPNSNNTPPSPLRDTHVPHQTHQQLQHNPVLHFRLFPSPPTSRPCYFLVTYLDLPCFWSPVCFLEALANAVCACHMCRFLPASLRRPLQLHLRAACYVPVAQWDHSTLQLASSCSPALVFSHSPLLLKQNRIFSTVLKHSSLCICVRQSQNICEIIIYYFSQSEHGRRVKHLKRIKDTINWLLFFELQGKCLCSPR